MLARHAVAGAPGRVESVGEGDYTAQYGRIVARLQAAGIDVVVLVGATAVPDREGLFSRDRYDRYREGARRAAKTHGAAVIEVERLLWDLPFEEAYRGIGIHWSPRVLERIAAAVVEESGAP